MKLYVKTYEFNFNAVNLMLLRCIFALLFPQVSVRRTFLILYKTPFSLFKFERGPYLKRRVETTNNH